ncbi:hypothetical protein [Pedobacter jeongneungensis]|uniref:hypothetical protein n=1 Tax=Pedobacter jeongneungensis TaxID=947309 RepID=UPI000469685D|nr:hypothetical protein [Pedobacter jeongneungensis]
MLSSLQNGQNYILDYSNGHLSDSYQKKGVLAVKKMQSVKGTTSYWQQECNQVVRNCTYSSLAPSWCGGIVNIVFSATCSWPQSTCGDTYSLVDSDEGVVCEDRWFPDPPEPIDTGGGSGGSGDGTTTTTPEEFNQHINLDELSPCASSVMHSLMYQTEGSVVAMIQKISGEVPGYSWTLKAGNLAVDTNGETKKSNGGATTTIDVSKYTNGTDMALARTLLHEAVHAYLVSYFTKNNTLANLSYPEMLVEWIKLEKKDMNVLHHIEITTEFKSDIAKGLMEYGDLHNYTFSSTVEKNQFYSDMAWGGLEATPAYKALSNTEKNRIQDTIQAEQYGKDRNGDPKAGKGKPSGC